MVGCMRLTLNLKLPEEAILVSVQDTPILQALGLYREQTIAREFVP